MNSFNKFSDLRLPPFLSATLEKLAFKHPTPIQATAIPSALAGKDILGIAPTGTGKTAAYGIPTLTFLYPRPGKQALVLAPTRELANQIFKFLRKLGENMGLQGTLLVGGESFSRQRAECAKAIDYIIATPGRLLDHVTQGFSLENVDILVLDEVDRMLDMGFAPQVSQLIKKLPSKRQTFLFSATLPFEIQAMADRYLKNPVRVTINAAPAQKPKIAEEKVVTTELEKPRLLVDQVKARSGKILVFANTQGRVEQVARRLKNAGESAECIHGGRTHGERKAALDAFRRGDIRVLIATDIVSRGIDVADIEHVINFDYPTTEEDYVHRIGRTGRIGRKGQALTFIDEKRKPHHRKIRPAIVAKSSAAAKPKSPFKRYFPTPEELKAGQRPHYYRREITPEPSTKTPAVVSKRKAMPNPKTATPFRKKTSKETFVPRSRYPLLASNQPLGKSKSPFKNKSRPSHKSK